MKNENQYRNLFLFLINTLLLYPSLSPYERTDRESNTLASRGLEEPAHASRGLEEPFFQLCCCVFLVVIILINTLRLSGGCTIMSVFLVAIVIFVLVQLGVVHAWVGQKRLKCNVFKTFW